MEMYTAFAITVFAAVTTCFAQQPVPAVLPQVIIEETISGVCPAVDVVVQVNNATKTEIRSILSDIIVPELDRRSYNQPQCPCGGPGQWSRIAHLNMSDPSQQCPSNWNLITTPVRGCGRSSAGGSCDSATFPSSGRSYSHVCGRVYAYEKGSPSAFEPSIAGNGLEDVYIEGVSLTHGAAGSRQHIWTFAAALVEIGGPAFWICSCTDTNASWPYSIPSFIGNNYFCDTGNAGPGTSLTTVYADDPLWDGEGCTAPTDTCCELNSPPWFCTTLPQPTTDDIEVRICHDQDAATDEDTIVSLIDIYVM